MAFVRAGQCATGDARAAIPATMAFACMEE
jgi:hypothetical protein